MTEKYPPLERVDLKTLRKVLKANKQRDWEFGVEELMSVLKIDAPKADAIAREAAAAGYLGWKDGGWVISSLGNRLRIDTLRKQILREKANAILDAVLARIDAFNRESGHLVRIDRAYLFGSYLDPGREMLGDVDLSVKFVRRDLNPAERERIETQMKPDMPDRYRLGVMSVFGAEQYDEDCAKRSLRKGLPGLSLTMEDVQENRFAHMVVYVCQDGVGRIVPPAERVMVNPENLGKTLIIDDEEEFGPVPEVTCRVPGWLPPDDEPVALDRRGCDSRELDEITAIAYDPGRNGLDAPAYKLAGAHHLCPAWTRDLGGVAMLAETLEWGREQGIIDEEGMNEPRSMTITFNGSSAVARLYALVGNNSASGPRAVLSGQTPSFPLLRYDRHTNERERSITRNQVAYDWSIAQSLRRCMTELNLKGEFEGSITYSLDILFDDGITSLPSLKAIVPLAQDVLEQGEAYSGEHSNLSLFLDESKDDPEMLVLSADIAFTGRAMIASRKVMARISERFEARRAEFLSIMKSAPGFEAIDYFEGRNRKGQLVAKDLEDPGPDPEDKSEFLI